MALDPDQDSPIVFDLVDEDAADPGAPPTPPHTGGADGLGDSYGAAPGSGEPSVPASQGGRRRLAAPVAAVLAIALGTGIASDGARDDARIERMRDVHGGVADLSVPLEETWAWEGAVGAAHEGYPAAETAAILDDVLVVESDGELVALEPATGEEAWAVPLGDDPECGPLGVSAYSGTPMTSTPVVVCVQGGGADREAIAVTPDGAVSAPRTLDPADTRRYGSPRPGPEGTVLRATRVGPESAVDMGNARCEEGACGGTIVAGRDVELRAEDAVTGEERWNVTVPFRPAQAGQCWGMSWEDPSHVMYFDGQVSPDAFGGRISADLVQLDGCGIEAAVTPDGVVFGTEFDPGMGDFVALEAGGYAGLDYGGPARTVLYADDGAVVGELPGYVLGPLVADGSSPATLLGMDETGRRLHAYEAAGAPRWAIRALNGEQPFFAQVGQTAMVTAGGADVRGLDIATGAERWHRAGESGDSVLQAFTDGQAVLLLLTQGGSGAVRMVSLDAASGELLWMSSDATTVDADGGKLPTTLVAVDGHLLDVDADGVRGLG